MPKQNKEDEIREKFYKDKDFGYNKDMPPTIAGDSIRLDWLADWWLNEMHSCMLEIEHCNDAPDCPECSILAYNKGREDMRLEIDLLIHNHTFDCDKVGTSVRELREKIKNIC